MTLYLAGPGARITAVAAEAAGGDLGGTYPNPTVLDLSDATIATIDLALVSSTKTWKHAVRSGDQSVTSSIAVVDDDTLQFAIAASEVWEVEVYIRATCSAAGGVRHTITGPAGSSGLVMYLIQTDGSSGFSGAGALAAEFATAAASAVVSNITMRSVITNGATPGSVKVRFAQGVSDGTATTQKTGSFLRAWRVS